MEESRKQRILLLFSTAAHKGEENLAMSAQEAVTGDYNPSNMNTGTYCSVISVELQNKIPVDGGPLFIRAHGLFFLTLQYSQWSALSPFFRINFIFFHFY